MIASIDELAVYTQADFDQLPDGRWEVVNGVASLMPPPKAWHQFISDRTVSHLLRQIEEATRGFVYSAVCVMIPAFGDHVRGLQMRSPDICISSFRVSDHYQAGNPPEWVIEILSTRRGNVERTEKMDDYARAGILEYWIINPIDREVEVYALEAAEYRLVEKTTSPQSITFPGVQIDMTPLWPELPAELR